MQKLGNTTEEATAAGYAGVAFAKQLGTTTLLAWGQGLLATALLAVGEDHLVPDLCAEAIRLAEDTRAIRIHQEFGSRPELARSYVTYACLLRRWNRIDDASRYLGEALTMFRAMGMEHDIAEAERDLPGLA